MVSVLRPKKKKKGLLAIAAIKREEIWLALILIA